jgi:hypothetical protein
MATVLEEYTTEEQHSVVPFLLTKELNAKDILKEKFPVYGGKYLPRKGVHNWVEKFSQERSKPQMMLKQVWKWLRQQSKDFYAAGSDALVKRYDRCIDVGEDMSRNKCFFFQFQVARVLRFISISDLRTDYPSYEGHQTS